MVFYGIIDFLWYCDTRSKLTPDGSTKLLSADHKNQCLAECYQMLVKDASLTFLEAYNKYVQSLLYAYIEDCESFLDHVVVSSDVIWIIFLTCDRKQKSMEW